MIIKYYNKKINDFVKLAKQYCKENDIEYSFKDFLNHKKNDICSPAYYYLHLCPSLFLANSKSFMEYYHTLDDDFRNDIITRTQIKEDLILLKRHKPLLRMIKKKLGEDSIL